MTIEAVDPRPRAACEPARVRAARGLVGLLLRFDWSAAGRTAAVVGYGIWAISGISAHEAGGSAAERQGLYAAVGVVLIVAASLIDPGRLPPLRPVRLHRHSAA